MQRGPSTTLIGVIILMIILFVPAPDGGVAPFAQSAQETIGFNGFPEGAVIRDQFMFRGLRLPAHPAGGPFSDDASAFSFLLDTPPGLLSLNPLAAIGGGGIVPSSVGTYVFDFVDPSNPFAPSFTDRVEVVAVLVDRGETRLDVFDAAGDLIGSDSVVLSSFEFGQVLLRVASPGIRRATLTTSLVQPTIGALVDTLRYERPAVLPARIIDIDIRPGARRNQIRLAELGTVPVAILSQPGFQPEQLDPAKILFQRASPVSFSAMDRNRDRVPDLVLTFMVADLVGLDASGTQATLTAVDSDGTPLSGSDSVIVRDPIVGSGPPSPPSPPGPGPFTVGEEEGPGL